MSKAAPVVPPGTASPLSGVGDAPLSSQERGSSAPRRSPRNLLNDLTGREWIKFTKTWFVCDSPRYHRNRGTELHPARFPEELAAEFVNFFTKRGEWVLDPFCGSGATLMACREQGRHAVGLELSARYAEITRQRLEQAPGDTEALVLNADARDALSAVLASPPAFDFLLTSPPYWDMLRHPRGGVKSRHQQRIEQGLDEAYSENPADLGNIIDYEEFVEALGGIFDGCRDLLKPEKYLAVVVQNLRAPGGEVKPLAWDLARRLSRSYSFQGERIWCQNSKPLGIWGYPKIFVPNYHHHYCLIFRKS
jgi:SAM-dependent methyltransferase